MGRCGPGFWVASHTKGGRGLLVYGEDQGGNRLGSRVDEKTRGEGQKDGPALFWGKREATRGVKAGQGVSCRSEKVCHKRCRGKGGSLGSRVVNLEGAF